MRKVYLDSNVLISSMREDDASMRPLFLEADDFFKKAAKNRVIVVLSELFFFEVENSLKISRAGILDYFSQYGITPEFVRVNSKAAKTLKQEGMHASDALHASTAIAENCDCIVTFNTKDFISAEKLIKVICPDEF